MSSLDAEFSGDDKANGAPWKPGTPPVTLLRLLGIRQSLDNSQVQQRPPVPAGARLRPGLVPVQNFGKTNRSSTSSSSSSFFAGFSRPEVAGYQLPEIGRHQENGNDPRRTSLRTQPGKPEAHVNVGPRLPHLQITAGGEQRWLSGDRDVALSSMAAVDDVTDTTFIGHTTDEHGNVSTISEASTSVTPPTAIDNHNDSSRLAPEIKDGVVQREDSYEYERQTEYASDDNETHGGPGGDPFHAVPPQHPPVWPVPQHHMPLHPSGQQRHFGPPSFGNFPMQRPIHGAPVRIHGSTAIENVDLIGQSSANWNGVGKSASDTTELPLLNPINQAGSDARTSPDNGLELRENFDETPHQRHESGLNTEEERTTWTSPGQPGATSAKIGDTVPLNENDTNRPATGYSTTMSSSPLAPVKSTVTGSITRGGSALWGAASWRHSTGVALSPTSFNLIGMRLFFNSGAVVKVEKVRWGTEHSIWAPYWYWPL